MPRCDSERQDRRRAAARAKQKLAKPFLQTRGLLHIAKLTRRMPRSRFTALTGRWHTCVLGWTRIGEIHAGYED
jgi:hypothetical protein